MADTKLVVFHRSFIFIYSENFRCLTQAADKF